MHHRQKRSPRQPRKPHRPPRMWMLQAISGWVTPDLLDMEPIDDKLGSGACLNSVSFWAVMGASTKYGENPAKCSARQGPIVGLSVRLSSASRWCWASTNLGKWLKIHCP